MIDGYGQPMDNTQPQQESSPSHKNYAAVINKKSGAGIIGFALGATGLLSFGLTAVPGFILCIIGIIRKGHRILSSIGLIICFFGLILLSAWTAPGSIPYPFSIPKYCLNAPPFWVGYDIHNLCEAQSQYWLFGGAGGALYFKSESPKTFEDEAIITFAGEHNWNFLNRVQLTEQDFQELLNQKGQVKRLDDETYFANITQDYEQAEKAFQALRAKSEILRNVTVGSQFPLWINKDCTILSFDTGNRASLPSHVVINRDGTEMGVYYNGTR
jgi:hypothetical protein